MNSRVLIEFYPQDPDDQATAFSAICDGTLADVVLKLLEHNACVTSLCTLRDGYDLYTISENFYNEYLFTEPPYDPVNMYCMVRCIPNPKNIKCITIDELDDLLMMNYNAINCNKDYPLYFLNKFSLEFSAILAENHINISDYFSNSKEKFLTLLYLKIEEFYNRI